MGELWLHGQVETDLAASAKAARAAGVTTVVAATSPDEAVLLRSEGLRPWACIGAFSVPADDTELQCRSADGEARYWFGSGCPSNRTVRERLSERVREVASWPIDGVLLDGIRFASPFEGRDTFFTCACAWCRAAATDRGFSFSRIAASLQAVHGRLDSIGTAKLRQAAAGVLAPTDALPPLLDDLGLTEWLAFRAALITDVVRNVRAVLRDEAPSMQLGAYVFTPSLAPLVGQDYARLAPLLDVVSPMIYRFYDGPACLPGEMLAMERFAPQVERTVMRQAVSRLLGLPEVVGEGDAAEVPVGAIARESARARARLGRGPRLVPILWLDDPTIAASVAGCMAGRPEGVSLYPYGESRLERLAQAAAYLCSYARYRPRE